MNTKDTIAELRLIASTIEELQIDNIISCELIGKDMKVHVRTLPLTNNSDAHWTERHTFSYPWEKSFTYNNIYFYALYSQKEYEKEKAEQTAKKLTNIELAGSPDLCPNCGSALQADNYGVFCTCGFKEKF